jgi:hypothetical protein
MRRNIIWTSVLLLAISNVSYAKENQVISRHSKSSYDRSPLKVVYQGGYGWKFSSGRLEVWISYNLNEKMSLQTGLSHFQNTYLLSEVAVSNGKSAEVKTSSISLPILLRYYGWSNKHICWSFGIRPGYIVKGWFRFIDEAIDVPTKSRKAIQDARLTNLNDINEPDKISRFQVDLVTGLDYEFESGIILGLAYIIGIVDVIPAQKSYFNSALHLSVGFDFVNQWRNLRYNPKSNSHGNQPR